MGSFTWEVVIYPAWLALLRLIRIPMQIAGMATIAITATITTGNNIARVVSALEPLKCVLKKKSALLKRVW